MNKKELNRKMKKQFWEMSKEWSRKDRIRGKIWWYLRPILPVKKEVRATCKQIKKASKLLRE